jgi:hypothetical protein
MKYANAAPIKKKAKPLKKAKHITAFSFKRSPGHKNFHISYKMIGEVITIPAITDRLIYCINSSEGEM